MKLDIHQTRAVESDSPRLLINAGAGSGKTRTLTERVGKLLADGVDPGRITVITFTRRAACEIKDRIATLGRASNRVRIGTIHSVLYKLLNDYAHRIRYRNPISIYDQWLQADMIADIMIGLGLEKEPFRASAPDVVFKRLAKLEKEKQADWIRINEAYKTRLRTFNAIDYDSIIREAIALLDIEDVRIEIRNTWEHLMVDEFQDTDKYQLEFIEKLQPKNLVVVGDDDQGIYGWRGARIRNIIDMARSCNVEVLATNYRSGSKIVQVANRLISWNHERLTKKLVSRDDAPSGTVSLRNVRDYYFEAAALADELKDVAAPTDIAILCRTNRGVQAVSEHLKGFGVNHHVISRGDFWDSDIVRSMVYTLNLIQNPRDFASWSIAANFPEHRLTPVLRSRIRAIAVEKNATLIEASKLLEGPDIDPDSGIAAWAKKLTAIQEIYEEDKEAYPSAEILEALDDVLGWTVWYRKRGLSFPARVIERIKMKMVELAADDEPKLPDFLSWWANRDLQESLLEETGMVVCTIHAAKGLEWKHVILPGWENGHFPTKKGELEEERRLAYVAITRAVNSCYILYSEMPSQFIEEAGIGAKEEQEEVDENDGEFLFAMEK